MAKPRSLWKFAKPPYAQLSSASAGDLDRSPRCDRQLSKPIYDLSILCWDLKALPTHHAPSTTFIYDLTMGRVWREAATLAHIERAVLLIKTRNDLKKKRPDGTDREKG